MTIEELIAEGQKLQTSKLKLLSIRDNEKENTEPVTNCDIKNCGKTWRNTETALCLYP